MLHVRRDFLKSEDARALGSLTQDRFPQAQPEVLIQVIERLHVLQENMLFQAAMASSVQDAVDGSRYANIRKQLAATCIVRRTADSRSRLLTMHSQNNCTFVRRAGFSISHIP